MVYVGDKTVTVKLNYQKVKVLQEGVPALYAILESDKGILRNFIKGYEYDILEDPKEDFESFFEKASVTPQGLLKDKRILHVDIGDGTTEYIYTKGMAPVPDACSGEKRGVGHATEQARNLLIDELNGQVRLNRQQYMQVMQDPTHTLYEDTNRFMEEARFSQALKIAEDVQEKFINNTSNGAQIIAVYGGGSIEFKKELYPELVSFASDVKIQILWIPKEYAVDLNVNGMQILNDRVLFKAKG
jgi:plasmid segregation protein ParM